MSKILDLYEKSEFAKLGSSNLDKTPISADGGKDLGNEKGLEKARGGKINTKKYSDTIER